MCLQNYFKKKVHRLKITKTKKTNKAFLIFGAL